MNKPALGREAGLVLQKILHLDQCKVKRIEIVAEPDSVLHAIVVLIIGEEEFKQITPILENR